MKQAYLVHGWGGNPRELLHMLLTKKLKKQGYEVHALAMPNADEPTIEAWVAHLQKEVKNPDEETLLIGHSMGCQAIMRYLETLEEDMRVGACIFIAGWFDLENMESKEEKEIARPWIEVPLDFDAIKKRAGEIIVYISSNEFYGCIEKNSKIFRDKLGANVVMIENMGHFTDDESEEKLAAFVKTVKIL